jgi:hypothetical protein
MAALSRLWEYPDDQERGLSALSLDVGRATRGARTTAPLSAVWDKLGGGSGLAGRGSWHARVMRRCAVDYWVHGRTFTTDGGVSAAGGNGDWSGGGRGGSGVIWEKIDALVSDGALSFVRSASGWVHHQRCVWHFWRNPLAGEIATALTEVAKESQEELRQESRALLRAILNASSYAHWRPTRPTKELTIMVKPCILRRAVRPASALIIENGNESWLIPWAMAQPL